MIPDSMLLSIVVPTYNRAAYLPDLLDSVVRELDRIDPALRPRVEVCVSDNASTDDTAQVVDGFRDRLNLRYHRHDTNLGPDRNFLAAVALGTGTFCWLMGSDDAIETDGLGRVLKALHDWPAVAGFSINVAGYDSALAGRVWIREPLPHVAEGLHSGAGNIYGSFVGHWGYLSAHIVRRALWQELAETLPVERFLNGYIHVYMMAQMVRRVPAWGYVTQRCVRWRSGNDSFLQGDWLKRMKIDVFGYDAITAEVFGDDPAVARTATNEIVSTHLYSHLRSAKARGRSAASIRAAAMLLSRRYWRVPGYRRKLLPLILTPTIVTSRLFPLYVRFIRSRIIADLEQSR